MFFGFASCFCLSGCVRGLEFEADVLAVTDALEVGLLVAGDVVVAEVKGCQCPDGGYGRCSMGGVSRMCIIQAPFDSMGALTCTRG